MTMSFEDERTLRQRLAALEGEAARYEETVRLREVQVGRLRDVLETHRGQAQLACAQTLEIDRRLTEAQAQVVELTRRLAESEAAAAASLEQAAVALRAVMRDLEDERAAHRAAIERIERDARVRHDAFARTVEDLSTRLATLQSHADTLAGSHSWRMTAPLRAARRLAGRGGVQGRGAVSRAVRWAYRHTPLTQDVKMRIKGVVFRHEAGLLRHTVAYAAWLTHEARHIPPAVPASGADPQDAPSMSLPAGDEPHASSAPEQLNEERAAQPVAAQTIALSAAPSPREPALPALLPWLCRDASLDAVPLTDADPCESRIKLIAFYSPSFYPIAENDAWRGRGFTDWTDVMRGQPRFPGHDQPRLPGELGFYDPRDSAVMQRQIELARRYGIHGFCLRYYWFSGERLLQEPLDRFLAGGDPAWPFCICWDNQSWTRERDGRGAVLIAQQHRPEDDLAFIRDLDPALRDPRYIRVDGRLLIIVQRPEELPDARRTAAAWRDYARDTGLGSLFLIAAYAGDAPPDPRLIGFDAALEYPCGGFRQVPLATPSAADPSFRGTIADYGAVVERSRHYRGSDAFPTFTTVNPSWDDDPRWPGEGTILTGASPAGYQEALENACRWAERQLNHDAPLVFVHGWNAWAEGAQLEPDRRYGYARLQATADALRSFPVRPAPPVVCVSHDAQYSGAQLLLLSLASALTDSLGRSVEIVLCGDGPLRREFAQVGRVHEFFPEVSLARREATARDLFAGGARIAFCNTAVVGDAAQLFKSCGFTVVSMIHELPGLMRTFGLGGSIAAIARTADHIVFPAEVVRDRFVEITGPPRGGTLVRPQGLYLANRFKGRREDARRELAARLGVDTHRRIVLGAGYADYRKGFDLFVETGLAAADRCPDCLFVWAGDHYPPVLAEARARIAAAGREELFALPGFERDPGVFFAAADAFLLTSREDPFPSVVLEALDADVPVIAFERGGGFVELLRRGCGLLVADFDPGGMADALIEILDDPARRRRLSAASRQILAAEFSFPEYARFLDRLASPPGPRVSAIVPNYNYERFLPGRLGSILAQTYPPSEIIFLDDCSSDGSVSVAEAILRDSGIPYRIIVNTRTEGCYRQWLRGLSEATGDLVWMAEADDACEPTLLSTLVPAFLRPKVVLAYCQSRRIDESGEELAGDYLSWTADISPTKWRAPYVRRGVDEIRDSLVVKNTIPSASAVLMRKADLSAIAAELVQFSNAGDWLAYVHLLEHGDVAFYPEFLNHHRRHPGGMTEQGGLNLVRESLLVQLRILERHIILPEVELKRDRALQSTYQHLGLDRDGPPSYRDHEALKSLLPSARV